MIEQLRQTLRALEKPAGFADGPGGLPLGVPAIDAALGGGLSRGALHEIAAVGEAHLAAAAGFALGLTSLRDAGMTIWLAEDMALAESGAPYGPGLEAFGLAPERLLAVAAAHRRDLLWAMEEALRCRAVSAVIGELRVAEIDGVAVRRLSLAAAASGALALLLRATPPRDASTAATRWIVGAARSARGSCNGVTTMSASCSQRLLSLWLRRLPTDRIARLREQTAPLVIYGKRGNAELLTAVDEAAERLGLSRGLALAQARAMHPSIEALEEDAEADAALLEQIADWCLRYTPLVACDPPGGLLLDISGCAHLYGGEEPLVADLALRLENAGFAFSIAIAGTIGAAWAAAHFGKPGRHACGEERALLSPLPLAALRVPAETVAALARVGLKRIGDIIDLPRAPLTARFGAELLRQLDRTFGIEHEPLNPRLPVAPYVAEQRFAEPIAREEDVLGSVARLAARLQFALERRGDGARRLELTLFRTDGALRRVAIGCSRPLREPADIRALFTERLAALADALDPGFGFDMARLSVVVAEPAPPEQVGIGGAEDLAELDRLTDRLSARIGARRVRRPIAQDSHIPEIAGACVPAQMTVADAGWEAFRRYRAQADLAPRPLRLLTRPEPIEAVAEVPDGPPLRFRWRRALHEVIAADGPERIEGAWWSEHGGPARDYFRVEDKQGLRFWLFRAGLYRELMHGAAAPSWFLHGMFA